MVCTVFDLKWIEKMFPWDNHKITRNDKNKHDVVVFNVRIETVSVSTSAM